MTVRRMSTPGTAAAGVRSCAPLAVLIVDDELFARTRLRTLVQACAEPRCVVAGEAGRRRQRAAMAARQPLRRGAARRRRCRACDGLQLADELRHRPQPPAVVFVTAHGEHALRAFELEATDYLTKPVRRERLQAALLRVAQRLQPRAANGDAVPMLVVSDRGRVLRIPATEVLYLKAELKYVTLRTADGEWVLDEALGDLEQRLGDGFLRVHRNALVARRAVRSLARHASQEEPLGWAVVLTNGEQLSVSRRQLTSVREALGSADT